MAYIEPCGVIRLLKKVPININMQDTLYFPDAQTQFTFFASYTAYIFVEQSYQRVERGKFRANICADEIYGVNYMMFQHASANSNVYGDKWFYAFVTSVEYINDVTSEVTFVIDDLQTWFFDYATPPCFVERMHNITDNIGDNIVPENLPTGQKLMSFWEDFRHPDELQTTIDLSNYIMLLCFSSAQSYNSAMNDGILGAGNLYAFKMNTSGIAKLNVFMQSNASQYSGIMGAYVCPEDIINLPSDWDERIDPTTGSEYAGYPLSLTTSGRYYTFTFSAITGNENFGGYTPRNKKLYTYPYNYLSIMTPDGKEMSVRYEFFASGIPMFRMDTNITYPVSCVVRPLQYKGIGNSEDYSDSIIFDGLPMCSIAIDAYSAWFAQNSGKVSWNNTLSLLTGSADAISKQANIMSNPTTTFGEKGLQTAGNIFTYSVDRVKQVGNLLVEMDYQHRLPNHIIGGIANGNNIVANHLEAFKGFRVNVNEIVAKQIDDYFTAFGYAQKKIIAPQIYVRESFTYVKTVGCVVKSSASSVNGIPADSAEAIARFYDNGIRFWHYSKADNFGDLTIQNNVLS